MSQIDVPVTPRRVLSAADIAVAAQLACLLEASAPKPGNVSPGRHFTDARYEDFLASAVAIGAPLAGAGERPVGTTVRLAVDATARWTRSNTNLGIVLLLSPLARAAIAPDVVPHDVVPRDVVPHDVVPHVVSGFSRTLRDSLRRVLDATTIDDARDVYAAIRRASPGGLGRAEAQDVASEPTIPLLDTMRLAADRDSIAREYASGFQITFESGAPALERARHDGLSWDEAILETFLAVLAVHPDTHVARRGGAKLAAEISAEAQSVLAAGGARTVAGRRAVDAMDRRMRDPQNLANPGTTADLTAAAIFVVLLGGGWQAGEGGRDAAPR